MTVQTTGRALSIYPTLTEIQRVVVPHENEDRRANRDRQAGHDRPLKVGVADLEIPQLTDEIQDEQEVYPYLENTNNRTIIMNSYQRRDELREPLEIADPPDFMDIDPREDWMSTELGARLWIYTLFSLSKSSIKGPNSGSSDPTFLILRKLIH